jgi:hypothetical protein
MTRPISNREKADARSVPQRYLSERDLSDYAGLSVKTLQAWRLYGKGPRFCHFGKAVRYDLREFDAWAAMQVSGGERA